MTAPTFDRPIIVLAALALLTSAPVFGPAGAWSLDQALVFVTSATIFAGLALRPASGVAALALAAALSIAPTILATVRAMWFSISADNLLANLFGAHGLLYGAPLLWAGYLGLIPLRHEDPKLTRLSLAAIVPGTLALLLTTERVDTPMRMATWLAFLLPGIAQCFRMIRDVASRQPSRMIAAAGALLILWNALFMEQYRRRLLPSDDTVSFAQVASNSAGLFSRALGTDSAWPANWIFAWRFAASPDQWDAVADRRLFASATSRTATVEVGDDASIFAPDVPLLLEGFGMRRTCERGWCRDVDGAARMLLPIQNPGSGEFVIRLRARGQGALQLSLNGANTSVSELTESLSEVFLRVPSGSIASSLNVLSLSVAKGGRATIDRLTLERALGSASAR
ncbi:MAG: hypothetical protein ABI565_06490 [Vicinamibacteria bacterium]